MSDVKIEYHPYPSVGHELGIMFGFGGLMLLSSIAYYAGWQVFQKRVARQEEERREALRATPLYSGKYGAADEKSRAAQQAETEQQVEDVAKERREVEREKQGQGL